VVVLFFFSRSLLARLYVSIVALNGLAKIGAKKKPEEKEEERNYENKNSDARVNLVSLLYSRRRHRCCSRPNHICISIYNFSLFCHIIRA